MAMMTEELTERQRYSAALSQAQQARDCFTDLTYQLPKTANDELLRLWNNADTAMLAFILAVEAALDGERGRHWDDDPEGDVLMCCFRRGGSRCVLPLIHRGPHDIGGER